MICTTCNGYGHVLIMGGWGPSLKEVKQPCPDCGGYGFLYCCEGEQCHPDESAGLPHQSTSADPLIDPPDPTS